jgi:hypothetical protein
MPAYAREVYCMTTPKKWIWTNIKEKTLDAIAQKVRRETEQGF